MSKENRLLIEKAADLCHRQWTGWMEYLFSKCEEERGVVPDRNGAPINGKTGRLIIPEWAVSRWKRQIATEYKDLPEDEKESDRAEADKYIELVEKFMESNELLDMKDEY